MKNLPIKILILGILILFQSCKKELKSRVIEEEIWKSGWEMIELSWAEKYELAEMKFDSLLSTNKFIGERFLIEGLNIKIQLSKEEETLKIFRRQSGVMKIRLCEQDFSKEIEACKLIRKEGVLNEELRLKLTGRTQSHFSNMTFF